MSAASRSSLLLTIPLRVRSAGRSPQCFRHWTRSRPFSARSTFSSRPQAARFPRTSLPKTPPPPRPRNSRTGTYATLTILTASAATLSPAALVRISEEDTGDGESGEQHMLEASRAELADARLHPKRPAHLPIPEGVWQRIVRIWDDWVWEPAATGLRFLHLLVIFVPVIVSAPAVWIGQRDEEKDNERSGSLWWYGMLVWSMEQAGPAFIKLGQWAASRQDIFPLQMCKAMSTLHSNAPAHSLRETKRIIRAAFDNRPFEDIFEEFDEKPLGVGAIAQVYKAKLKPDLAADADHDIQTPTKGRMRRNVNALVKSSPRRVPSSHVAVKVRHPRVERTVRRDLRIMSFFARALNAIPTMEWFSFPDEVDQFAMMMRLQLDFRIEAANLTIFRKNFRDRATAWFPYPYQDYTTRQVLVEEFAHGIPLAAFLESGGGSFQSDIANQGLDAFLRMLLLDNFVHADLHPGNIMVRFHKHNEVELPMSRKDASEDSPTTPTSDEESIITHLSKLQPKPTSSAAEKKAWTDELSRLDAEGYRPQLIFIDTGLVTSLSARNRRNFLDLFRAIAEFDGKRAGQLMVARSRQPGSVRDGDVFALRIQNLVLGVKRKTFALGNVKIGDILGEVLALVRRHRVRIEGDYVNVVISILLLEGIGRTLEPNLDLFKSALPILRQLGSQQGATEMVKSVRQGDFSMLKVWAGLEARKFLLASVEDVERLVKSDLLSPNI